MYLALTWGLLSRGLNRWDIGPPHELNLPSGYHMVLSVVRVLGLDNGKHK